MGTCIFGSCLFLKKNSIFNDKDYIYNYYYYNDSIVLNKQYVFWRSTCLAEGHRFFLQDVLREAPEDPYKCFGSLGVPKLPWPLTWADGFSNMFIVEMAENDG